MITEQKKEGHEHERSEGEKKTKETEKKEKKGRKVPHHVPAGKQEWISASAVSSVQYSSWNDFFSLWKWKEMMKVL